MSFYFWKPYIRCTNTKCRMMMFGKVFGNNGVLDPRKTNRDGEDESRAELEERWNEKPLVPSLIPS